MEVDTLENTGGGMTDRNFASQAQRMRTKAEEIRALADRMHYTVPRNTMLRLAETFERLAGRLESKQGPLTQ
jgi:hypothetical protein